MNVGTSSTNHAQFFLKILPTIILFGQVSWPTELRFKRYIQESSCGRTEDDVTTFQVDEIVWNKKKIS